jgi:hypothetical protein
MQLRNLRNLIALLLVIAPLTGCIVERRVERPRGCRHGVYVEGHHGRAGHWRCHEDRRHVIIVR